MTASPHLLSGLLKCGSCGSSMIVVGGRTKNGRRYATFGCGANRTKGNAICANKQTISEKKITEAVIGALRDLLLQPGLVQRFVERFNERMQEAQKAVRGAEADRKLSAEIEAARRRVRT